MFDDRGNRYLRSEERAAKLAERTRSRPRFDRLALIQLTSEQAIDQAKGIYDCIDS